MHHSTSGFLEMYLLGRGRPNRWKLMEGLRWRAIVGVISLGAAITTFVLSTACGLQQMDSKCPHIFTYTTLSTDSRAFTPTTDVTYTDPPTPQPRHEAGYELMDSDFLNMGLTRRDTEEKRGRVLPSTQTQEEHKLKTATKEQLIRKKRTLFEQMTEELEDLMRVL